MQLTSQGQNIKDSPAFLLAMAEALEDMHGRQKTHGSVVGTSWRDWLDENGAFQAYKFEARASVGSSLRHDALVESDVRRYAEFSIECIVGPQTVTDKSFVAAPYQGKEWPDGFLQLLESFSKPDQPVGVSMANFSSALKATEAGKEPKPEPIPVTAGYSGPPSVKPAPQPQMPAVRIALRNATVGKPYCYEPGQIASAIAQKLGNDPARAYISHLQLPDDCGLAFDKATGALSGKPTRPFDGELSLDYVPSDNARSITAKVTLLINPDPLSLWKDLPPPADAPYQKQVLAHSEERLGPFRIVAASRRGRSHANKSEFRDDDYAIGYAAESGWLVVVVADGAGSAIYSRRGSQIACDVAKNRLLTVLNSAQHNQAGALYLQHGDWQHPEVKKALRQCLYEAALLAHHKLRAEVAQPTETLVPPPTLRNYDTTLILLVMKRTGEGCIAATFSIGDGGVGILLHAGKGIPLTKADSGEHAGQTIFLTFDSTVANTEANLESRFQLAQTQKFVGALAMTDGITDPKFPSDAAFADPAQWAALWAELQPALTGSQVLLDWMNFFSPGNHDDRTLVAILPAPSATLDTL